MRSKRLVLTLVLSSALTSTAQDSQQSDKNKFSGKADHQFVFKATPEQCTDVTYKEIATGVVKDAGGATPRTVLLAPKLYEFTCKCPSGDQVSQPTMVAQISDYTFYCKAVAPQPTPPPKATWHTEDQDGRPYVANWQFAPNCRGQYGLIRVDDTHRCDIEPTQIHVNGDKTGYDTWNLWMDAPQGALVYEVGCEPTGEHEIQPRGIVQGQTGLCTGLINGGAAPIRMYIKWKELR